LNVACTHCVKLSKDTKKDMNGENFYYVFYKDGVKMAKIAKK
jgi:hypothetical protein